jgi:hypothetical protein
MAYCSGFTPEFLLFPAEKSTGNSTNYTSISQVWQGIPLPFAFGVDNIRPGIRPAKSGRQEWDLTNLTA